MAKKTKPAKKDTKAKGKKDDKADDKKAPTLKSVKSPKLDWVKLEHEKVTELVTALDELREAEMDEDNLKEEHANAKKLTGLRQLEVNAIATQLKQIRSGTYQQGLPFPSEVTIPGKPSGPAPVDEGAAKPLSALKDFGLTASKLELIEQHIEGSTVGALEKFQRDNLNWVEKITRLGPEGANDVLDAQAEFRKKFPFPDPVLTASEKESKGGSVRVSGQLNQTFPSTGEAVGAILDHAKKSFKAEAKPQTHEERAYVMGCDRALAGGNPPNDFPEESPLGKCWRKGFDDTNNQTSAPETTGSAA